MTAAFVQANDAETSAAAAIMDAVVNEFFLKHCPPHSKVLDLGSGHGIVSAFLARHGHAVTACDVSEPMLKVLAEKCAGLDISIRHGDAHKIPAANGEFDVVVARMFLGHFPDWPDILCEMARCCRSGGQITFDFTNKENAEFGRRHGRYSCTFGTSPKENDPSRYFAEVDQGALEKVCARLGLRIIERAPITFFLHNRLIGHCLGAESYQAYQDRTLEFLRDPKVREFVIWFEQTVVQHLPAWATYYNCVALEKRT